MTDATSSASSHRDLSDPVACYVRLYLHVLEKLNRKLIKLGARGFHVSELAAGLRNARQQLLAGDDPCTVKAEIRRLGMAVLDIERARADGLERRLSAMRHLVAADARRHGRLRRAFASRASRRRGSPRPGHPARRASSASSAEPPGSDDPALCAGFRPVRNCLETLLVRLLVCGAAAANRPLVEYCDYIVLVGEWDDEDHAASFLELALVAVGATS